MAITLPDSLPTLICAPKWYTFKANTPRNRQKLPEVKKYVLVMLKSSIRGNPNPIVVGYLKFHAGELSEPYFVTPGANVPIWTDDRVIAWCDGIYPGFEWPEGMNEYYPVQTK